MHDASDMGPLRPQAPRHPSRGLLGASVRAATAVGVVRRVRGVDPPPSFLGLLSARRAIADTVRTSDVERSLDSRARMTAHAMAIRES